MADKNILKHLKTKFFEKSLTWDDVAKVGIYEHMRDGEPFDKRWCVTHGLFPGLSISGSDRINPTEIYWPNPNIAFGFYHMKQRDIAFSQIKIKQGILFMKGKISTTYAEDFLKDMLGSDVTIIDSHYAPHLSREEIYDLREDGIMDDRSNMSYIYFDVK